MLRMLIARMFGWLPALVRFAPKAVAAVEAPPQPRPVTPGQLASRTALDESLRRVTDEPPHYDRITRYYVNGLGWPGAEPQNPPRPYRDAPGQAWCGAFAAFVHVVRREGDTIGPLSGPRRLQSASTYKLHAYAKDRCVWHRGDPETLSIEPGDVLAIATTKGLHYGDHIGVAVAQPTPGSLILTVEGNAHGAQVSARRTTARRVEGVVLRGRAPGEVVAVYRWRPEDYDPPAG